MISDWPVGFYCFSNVKDKPADMTKNIVTNQEKCLENSLWEDGIIMVFMHWPEGRGQDE